MQMKNALTIVAAVAASMFAQASFAESDSAPLTRAEVKAETKAAAKNKELTPAGQDSPKPAAETGPAAARADVKADTKAAAKAKELTPAGEGSPTPKK